MKLKNKLQQLIKFMAQHKRTVLGWFLLLVVVQSIFAIYAIVRIPIDPKNLTSLGTTRGRLALIVVISLLDCLAALGLFYYEAIKTWLSTHPRAQRLYRVLPTTALILMAVLWVSLWLPKYRLDTLAEEYERMRPFLLWLGIAGLELFALLWIFSLERESQNPERIKKQTGKPFLIIFSITAVFVLIYLYFNANISFKSGIIGPALAPVTPLQLFLFWLLTVVLYRIQQKTTFISQPNFIAICAVLLYLASSGLSLSAPLACKGDLVGIYPPNFTCYPDINDAVYDVGSLYIHYGEGVFNQWFTDKPLYMLFLAGCQWLGGTQIQHEMAVQVLCLSALPVLVFLFTRRLSGFPGALLAALLLIAHQENAILLYSKLGGVNVRIAATEIFTALLLVCTAWFLNKWFRKPAKAVFPLASGICLGLAILTRFNAVLIVPVILLASVIYYWKAKGLGLRKLAVFCAGLALVLSPWFLVYPAINPHLENPYVEKIRNVFWDRTSSMDSPKVLEKPPAITLINDAEMDRSDALQRSDGNSSGKTAGGAERGLAQQVLLHFTNNVLTTFFSLPVNSTYLDVDTLTEQPFWYRDNQPIWQKTATSENLALWCLSVALFVWGIQQSWRRWGMGGLAPLLVLLGYLLGDSLALTSGGRYLEPVLWAVFLYYAIGLAHVSVYLIHKLGFIKSIQTSQGIGRENGLNKITGTLRNWLEKPVVHYSGLGVLVLATASLAFLQFLPERLPAEVSLETTQTAYGYLDGKIDQDIWDAFLQADHSVVAAGALYYPQYYSQSRFSLARGTDVFEALVLSRDHVYMSYMWNRIPSYISDGSRVILVGCVLNEGQLWGMERRITQTYVLIQLDNEKQIYIDPQASWTCP